MNGFFLSRNLNVPNPSTSLAHSFGWRDLLLSVYEHTQPGTLIRVWVGLWATVFAAAAVVMLTPDASQETAVVFGVVAVICTTIVFLFHSLTVRVSQREIVLSFGVGMIRKSFLTDEIEAVEIVKNRWYYGWGIRRIRGGWLYNVSGWDAIEVRLKNKCKYRIGTDDAENLFEAVQASIAHSLRSI